MPNDEQIIICRCEDVTLSEIREALRDPSVRGMEDLKRILRVTMGPCAGRSCRELIMREIAKVRGSSVEEVAPTIFRPPTTPLRIDAVTRRTTDIPTEKGDGNAD